MTPPSSTSAMPSYDEALSFLDGLDVSAMKLGLDRVRAVLGTLGNPQDSLPVAHIAGTNGKGSVTAMLASILKAAGYRTGSFISPHLVHVRERIAINGNPILPDDFAHEVASLKAHLERLDWPRADWPTYFEFINVMAYRHFLHRTVDVAVFETGLGGRLDSTNVVRQPRVTAITTIGMDHMQHLGSTLAEIAAEKAGIIKPGVPLVLGADIPAEARAVILARAAELAAPVFEAKTGGLRVSAASNTRDGLLLEDTANGRRYRLGLLAPYQAQNLGVVLGLVDCLRAQGFAITEEALQAGLMQARWPARFQYFEEDALLVDGSHNPDGFAALDAGLCLYFANRPLAWLVSLRANRDPASLIAAIRQAGAPVAVITTCAEPARLYHTPEALADACRHALGLEVPVMAAATPAEGLALLRAQLAGSAELQPLGVVTGSLYTAGAVLEALSGN